MTVQRPMRRDGDPFRYEELMVQWSTWRSRFLRYAKSKLDIAEVPASMLEPDDVVQYAWLALFTRRDYVWQADRYVYTVIRHITKRAGNERRREGFWVLADALHTQGFVRSAELEAIRNEIINELESAQARQLTARQRAILRALIDLKIPAPIIANELGISIGTVYAHRARALEKLRKDQAILRIDPGDMYMDSSPVGVRPSPYDRYTPEGWERLRAYAEEMRHSFQRRERNLRRVSRVWTVICTGVTMTYTMAAAIVTLVFWAIVVLTFPLRMVWQVIRTLYYGYREHLARKKRPFSWLKW